MDSLTVRRALAAVLAYALLVPVAAHAAPPIGSVTEFPASTGDSANGGLVVGPDHNLWYTRLLNDEIVRMTASGATTAFTVSAVSEPAGIAAGPDGALWFSESGAGRVARITTSGTVTGFPLPSGAGASSHAARTTRCGSRRPPPTPSRACTSPGRRRASARPPRRSARWTSARARRGPSR